MNNIEETTIETLQQEPSIVIDNCAQIKLCNQIEEEGQVIVHCSLSLPTISRIRVWRTTYLFDKNSTHKSQLIHAEGIHIFPQEWMSVGGLSTVNFTLIFSSLPRHCMVFDLYEQTQGDPGNFSAKAIVRNESDVYHVSLGY